MGLTVTLVTGPRRSGKSTVIRAMIDEILDRPPHYLRLSIVDDGVRLPARNGVLRDPNGAPDAEWLCSDRDRVFELLPESLAVIHKRDRYARVVIEADFDPALRHAYPYDQQVFVMPAPRALSEVFRTPGQAARALQDALDDTSFFAAEVFGLEPAESATDDEAPEQRDLLTKSQIKRFLASPLGDQLATQIQLRTAYHGLTESDLVLVNTALGGGTRPVLMECRRRLEELLARVRGAKFARDTVFCCDPKSPTDPERTEFMSVLTSTCRRA